MLAKLLRYIGIALAALGIIGLSPLVDLLPIEFAANPLNFFSKPDRTHFYRLVPSEQSPMVATILLVVGLAMYIAGRLLARRQ